MAKESEETALREALLLVELLKTEYARVLRDRSQRFSREDEVDEKDLETCATTSLSTTPAQTNTTWNVKSSRPRPFTAYGFLGPRPGLKQFDNKSQKNRRVLQSNSFYNDLRKRRFNDYRDYYGYNEAKPWRRMPMDYDPIFGPQPNETDPTSPTTQDISDSSTDTTLTVSTIPSSVNHDTSTSSTTNTSTNIVTNKTESPTSTTPESSPSIPNTNSPPTSSRTSTTTSATLTDNTSKITKSQTKLATTGSELVNSKKLHYSLEETTESAPSANDPEQAQIVSELEQELESDIISSNSLSSSTHAWRMTWPPSTRIHLAKSTRYPIPLPENHAFCYTNPESPLCRTFI